MLPQFVVASLIKKNQWKITEKLCDCHKCHVSEPLASFLHGTATNGGKNLEGEYFSSSLVLFSILCEKVLFTLRIFLKLFQLGLDFWIIYIKGFILPWCYFLRACVIHFFTLWMLWVPIIHFLWDKRGSFMTYLTGIVFHLSLFHQLINPIRYK